MVGIFLVTVFKTPVKASASLATEDGMFTSGVSGKEVGSALHMEAGAGAIFYITAGGGRSSD